MGIEFLNEAIVKCDGLLPDNFGCPGFLKIIISGFKDKKIIVKEALEIEGWTTQVENIGDFRQPRMETRYLCSGCSKKIKKQKRYELYLDLKKEYEGDSDSQST